MTEKPVNYPAAFGYLQGSITFFANSFASELLESGCHVDWDMIEILRKKLNELPKQARDYGVKYDHDNPDN
jgi:hypothetical protein